MTELLTAGRIMRETLSCITEPTILSKLNALKTKSWPTGVQVTMGRHIIGQWHETKDGCRYESYGEKRPRYIKIRVPESMPRL